MTILMPTCQRVTALLTDFEEGALGPLDWLGLKLHLALCPPCQTFLRTFEFTPGLLRWACDDDPTRPAEQALVGALRAIREGRTHQGPQHHPEAEAWAALEPGGDPFTALLLRAHLGHCGDCREARGAEQALSPTQDPLEALRPHLPPEAQWRWIRRGLDGGRVAILREDPASGASLSLTCLPGGRSTPIHDHLGQERALILCGALQDGPAHLRPGDWMAHAPGHIHGPTADPGGECWALLNLEQPVQFKGWRGLVAGSFSGL